jgi:hypothetical protein
VSHDTYHDRAERGYRRSPDQAVELSVRGTWLDRLGDHLCCRFGRLLVIASRLATTCLDELDDRSNRGREERDPVRVDSGGNRSLPGGG